MDPSQQDPMPSGMDPQQYPNTSTVPVPKNASATLPRTQRRNDHVINTGRTPSGYCFSQSKETAPLLASDISNERS